MVRSVHGVDTGSLLRTRVSDGELVSTVDKTTTVDSAHRQSNGNHRI